METFSALLALCEYRVPSTQYRDYFDYSLENDAVSFLNGRGMLIDKKHNSAHYLEHKIINDYFTVAEIENAIDCLKCNNSPGVDHIPAEFIKHCKGILSGTITEVFSYVVEKRDFPECWAEGLRSAIHQSERYEVPENYRGITILPVLEKVFEIAVYKIISFANDAFCKVDQNNGGFIEGRRTSDNLFIINGLAQRQMLLNKHLILCFVDFSKAFDMVNRSVLFYKIMKCGWNGKVIDTLRSLYTKTKFRVKHQGWLSHLVDNVLGVNQDGVASGFLFRKYMSDLGTFLDSEYGICVGEKITAHILWADDLVLISDSEKGMQRQLDGLLKFCSLNLMSVNEIKTKCMAVGSNCATVMNLSFNSNEIEQVTQYKCLGVIVKSIRKNTEDMFANNYPYLCDQGRKALFGILHRLRSITPVPPNVMFKLFNTVVKPILIYGSDVWGCNRNGTSMLDKVMLRFCRCFLNVKATTSNIMVYGECGMLPPSLYCNVSAMCYINRLHHMPNDSIVKQVYNELVKLTQVSELVDTYHLDIDNIPTEFKFECKESVANRFIDTWMEQVQNTHSNPILRTYCNFKHNLDAIKKHKYRVAMSQLRTSSHTLAIEYGRYTRPKTKIEDRNCSICHVLEDERHFVMGCTINQPERENLFSKLARLVPNYTHMNDDEKFLFLMCNKDPQILTWVGKFIHKSFKDRDEHLS